MKVLSLTQVIFLSERKKENAVLINESDKQYVKKYHLVSPLLICSKIFEYRVYRTMFSYLLRNNLISEIGLGLTC